MSLWLWHHMHAHMEANDSLNKAETETKKQKLILWPTVWNS